MPPTMTSPRTRLIVPLDFQTLREAVEMAQRLAGLAEMFKVGLELFNAEGPPAIRAISDIAGPVFYDCKLFDIPNTVAGAAASVTRMRVGMFNVHALGGREMMRAAARVTAQKAADLEIARPLVLGVTMVTSLGADDLQDLGIARTMRDQVVALAQLSRDCGLDGVVASPHEIAEIKQACGDDFIVVAPGVRPAWASHGDQKRVTTPNEAAAAGADYVVIGRPITQAADPAAAAMRVAQELAEA